jgi:hypothetical protein
VIFFRFLIVVLSFPFVFALNLFVLLWTLLRVSADVIIDGESELLKDGKVVDK